MRLVCGVGLIGEGPHNSVSSPAAHRKWCSMLKRVYAPESQQIAKDYEGCSVAPEWMIFQNFATWFSQQPFAGEQGYELDKDLKVKGNRTYGPLTCSIIPRELNSFISADRRMNLHGAGVGKQKLSGRFFASIKFRGEVNHLGTYRTADEAAAAYRKARPEIMRRLTHALLDETRITGEQAQIAIQNYGTEV